MACSATGTQRIEPGALATGMPSSVAACHVYVVYAGPHLADHLDVRPRLHQFPRDGGEPGEERARARGLLAQGVLIERIGHDELIPLVEIFLHEDPARGLRKGALIHA